MKKLHGYLLGSTIALSVLGGVIAASVKNELVEVKAESYVIGTDARDNYRKWGADSNLMVSSTMFYVDCEKDGTSGSKVSKDITYTWSGCSNPLEKRFCAFLERG